MMNLKKIYRAYIKRVEGRSQKIRIKKQWLYEWYEILLGSEKKARKSFELSKAQKREIDLFWKTHYGRTIPYIWHQKYTYYSGQFRVDYFPEILYTTVLEPEMNPDRVSKILENKAYVEFLFQAEFNDDLVVPQTVGGCSGGYCFDEHRNPTTKDELIEAIAAYDRDMIIKPSVGCSAGQGVKKLSPNAGCDNVKKLLEEYKDDFIVQEMIRQHESYAKLHASSVNTVRIMSYRVDDAIHITPSIMRIGRGDNYIDNAHAGGMYIGIHDDGTLYKTAIVQSTNSVYEQHPDSNIIFENYKLYGFDKIKSYAAQLHRCLPDIGFVNWDFAVDENGRVVLIEINLNCGGVWIFQNTCGKAVFGDDTEYMIKKIRKQVERNE